MPAYTQHQSELCTASCFQHCPYSSIWGCSCCCQWSKWEICYWLQRVQCQTACLRSPDIPAQGLFWSEIASHVKPFNGFGSGMIMNALLKIRQFHWLQQGCRSLGEDRMWPFGFVTKALRDSCLSGMGRLNVCILPTGVGALSPMWWSQWCWL